MSEISERKTYLKWILLLSISMIWGSSFILMKKGLESYSFMEVAALRIFISFLIFSPVIVKKLKILKLKDVKSYLIVGYIGTFFPAFLFTKAETEISSSFAGMLNSLSPLFTLFLGIIIYGTSGGRQKTLGVLIGLIGAIGLIWSKGGSPFSGTNWYAFFVVLATFFYGISINEVKAGLSHIDGLSISAFTFLFTGPAAGLWLLFSGFNPHFSQPGHAESMIYTCILALFSSVIAAVMFNNLIRMTSSVFAATATYVMPFFAILWGLSDGEKVIPQQILFLCITVIGIYLINKPPKINFLLLTKKVKDN
jgi:drug/metabolite transporter (DMT)-like permease